MEAKRKAQYKQKRNDARGGVSENKVPLNPLTSADNEDGDVIANS